MKLGSGIRFALAAATLLAQLVLPVAHGIFAAAEPAGGSGPALATATDRSIIAAHDPSSCPICVAVCQARAGIGRTLSEDSLPLENVPCDPVHASIALPQTPGLDSAPPRAPPVLALAFA